MTTHRRLRPFNTRDTYPEQRLDNDLCQIVVARGTMVFVRGQIGQDLDTRESVGVGDATAQAEQAMANVKMLLEEAGSCLQHICKITIYLIDPRYREPVYRVVGAWLKGCSRSPPTSSSAPLPVGMGGRDRRHGGHP